MFHPPSQNNLQNFNPDTPMLPPSFIKNNFYQVSPQREPQQVPILFDKRPYTASGAHLMMKHRSSANKV